MPATARQCPPIKTRQNRLTQIGASTHGDVTEFLKFLNKAGGVETISGSVVNLNGEWHRGLSLDFSVPAQGEDR